MVMRDQAQSLRQQSSENSFAKRGGARRARVIAVTSGKGGVGKTNVSVNLSIALSRLGKKVLLIDADTNLANVDILLGLHVKYTLADVIFGSAFFGEALIEGPEGITILPGSSGVVEMMEQDTTVRQKLFDAFDDLQRQFDILLIDTGAGLTENIMQFVLGADDVVLVTNAEPTSITDAYAMIKVATYRDPSMKIKMLVNLARSREEAYDTFEKLQLAVRNFLQIDIEMLGFLPIDPNIPQAVAERVPFLTRSPRSAAATSLTMMARRLLKNTYGIGDEEESFLEKMVRNKGEE